jgi:predicted enzyme related to lactoylglutathione lyase
MPSAIRLKSAVPQFSVPDVVRTAEYYRDVFGFEIRGYWNGSRVSFETTPPPVFAIVRRDTVEVFFGRIDSSDENRNPAGDGYHAYFHVSGVDPLAKEFRDRGADILDEPEDRIYLQRELVVRDCNGLFLAFGEDISEGAA